MENVKYNCFSDEELLTLVKNGDLGAFDEIYKRCSPILIRIAAKKLQSKETAEDIVQDLFVGLFLKSKELEITVSLKAYLYRAVEFKMKNVVRARIVREEYKRFIFFSPVCKNDFANNMEFVDCQKKIHHSLKNLPEKCRKVFELSRNEEFSYKDISENLGISVSTVEKHISKALKVLRKEVLDAA